ncbi:MAG: hypothetical protein U0790_08055 [Isosphaeraceae bacterium]
MSQSRSAVCAVMAGAIMFAVGALFHLVIPVIAPSIPPQFENAALFRRWEGWTRNYMAIHPFGFGVVFATVYLVLLGRGGVTPGWRDGILYGLGVFLVGSLPVFLLAFASFNLTPEIIVSWVAQNVCQYTAAGLAIGLVARRA